MWHMLFSVQVDRTLDANVPKLQQWLYSFLSDNVKLSSANATKHKLILAVSIPLTSIIVWWFNNDVAYR